MKNGLLPFKNLTIDVDKQLVLLEREAVELTTMEFEILHILMKNQGVPDEDISKLFEVTNSLSCNCAQN